MPDTSPPTRRSKRSDKAATRRRDLGKSAGAKADPRTEVLPKIIGSLFRTARQDQHLSQDQVSDLTDGHLAHVSRTAISDIERGHCLPGLEALVALSRVLHVEPTEIYERVDLARRTTIDLTDMTLDQLRKRSEEQFWSGDYRGALQSCDAMLDRLQLDPPKDRAEEKRLRAKIEIDRALALRRCSALKAALASALRAVELSAGLPKLDAEAYMVLGSVLSHEGLSVLAQVAVDQAIQLSMDGDEVLRGRVWNQRGNVLFRSGQPAEARRAFLEARKLLSGTSDYHHQIRVEGSLGACLLELGKRDSARQRFRKAVDLARKHHEPAMEASWLVELGRLALADGELDDAETYAGAALRIAKPAELYLTIFRAEWLRHLIVLERDPQAPDRHRLAYLRRLYARIQDHRGLDVVKEFEAAALRTTKGRERRSS